MQWLSGTLLRPARFAVMLSAAAPPPSAARCLRAAEAALTHAWAKGWADRPSLDPDDLVASAVRRSRAAADDGDAGWRARLGMLCDDLAGEAKLTALGRTIAHGQLVGALAHRFRAQALWRRHPAIADQPLRAPIIVVGQMRSGTTRMQRLLACDPRLAATRFYESWTPIPATRLPLDDRKWKARLALWCARIVNPAFRSIHATRWNAVDEEIGLHSLSVFGGAFEAQWRVPRLCRAVEEEDSLPVYREFRRLLQTIAWLRRDDGSRPWVLKVPQFTQDLASLLQVFPDARLVCVSRDPARVIASSASLVANQMRLQSRSVDTAWIEREWTRKFRLRATRTDAALAASSAPRVAIGYDEVSDDWEAAVRRVHAAFGMATTDDALAAMRSYMRAAARGARRHDYAMTATAPAMTERLAPT